MVSRKQFFIDLRELIDSAESNFDHGRPQIGKHKLDRAEELISEFRLTQIVQAIKAGEG